MTMMLTWLGADGPSMEGARVVLGERRMRATGALVSGAHGDQAAYSATYSIATAERGDVSRVSVRAVDATGERQVTLNRSEEGVWLVDHGQGVVRNAFEGAMDVDVSACVLFNTIPVRRLGLHERAGEHTVPVVWVRLPDLSVQLVRQTYRCATPGAVTFSWNDFTADLTLDDRGLVIDYPGVAKRI